MTFKQIYEEERNKPTAAQQFISEVAEITHKSQMTVKMWLVGRQTPDELTQSVLANHFGVKAEKLFPKL